ncbi:hypothetical protein [Chroococcus sp. FPU101]|uniref:hypothetical protein n=1 Tax=Chroococcus sp. FPU101 TaxID=1974212 RepID=UPI001A906EEA|nr:hypothetical protein [Chroococcus sp. FPU101]GFE72208.1 hypothetical protein CFPU101_48180 [Chroococcus sp. FPU101]
MSALIVFGQRPKDSIFMPQVPYAVRNDCSTGQWKIGDDDFRGNTIEISIIKVAQFFGTLGKTQNTQWFQVWFIPAPNCENLPKNTVCYTYIKTRSITQFSQKVTELMESGEPAEGIFLASFEKHSNEYGNYYSIKWDWRERQTEPEKKQLSLIASFLLSRPQLVDLSTKLIPIDGLTPEEIERIVRSLHSEGEPTESVKPSRK